MSRQVHSSDASFKRMAKQEHLGFGFNPIETQHHFLVTIPSRSDADVLISEHFVWDEEEAGRRDTQLILSAPDSGLRCILERVKWEAVSEDIKAEFNRRLKNDGLKAGRWKSGATPLARTLGKELVVLAWGIENAEFALLPTAVRNWQGLTPEERWWLYTMTNAATGHPTEGRQKGWRKAIRFALTENPVGDVPLLDRNTFGVSLARGREAPRKAKKQPGGPSLFDDEEARS